MKHNLAILKWSTLAAAACLAIPGHALTIVANFGASDGTGTAISSLSNASAVEADINSMISYYEATITNNLTVHVNFENMTSGLGMSSTYFTSHSYSDYLSKLNALSSGDALDTAALAKLSSNPYTGSDIAMTTANARAVGYTDDPGTDATIYLNTALCFTDHNSPVSGQYDLYAIVAHEFDEVLGTSSGIGNDFQTADLFRYDSSGNRSFTTDTSQNAYFSVDGTNLIEQYNTSGYGDWGDWIKHDPAQVQDYAGTPGVSINVGTGELDLLDAIGYNIQTQSVPEPSAFAALGLGLVALVKRRRR